jgi:hypothetical protein
MVSIHQAAAHLQRTLSQYTWLVTIGPHEKVLHVYTTSLAKAAKDTPLTYQGYKVKVLRTDKPRPQEEEVCTVENYSRSN